MMDEEDGDAYMGIGMVMVKQDDGGGGKIR